ncbi:putative aconitase subunit 1 [Anaerobacterium chartisolvens]|uniref:Putative aconitase subunit 1 n=2 Tax=Anaerobacterium chartisolvens TaxID=1297424 RepID=A0A369AQL6_9FIRM|nr:putative aconitase subunit 1 [Anaerobacterium chartisolvens]
MELTDEERALLKGEKGQALRKAMESVVVYGEAFGAKRLLPVNGPVHVVTSFGIPILEPVFDMMDELIAEGLAAKQPFTVNPRPIDYANVRCGILQKLAFKVMYGRQKEYEKQLERVGLKSNKSFTCTCYLPEVGNTPQKGDVLAWAESSAVVYANSVIGARTNRNSGVIELLSGIIGRTPEFGLLTDEGRRAKWLIEVKTQSLPNPQVLGGAIGMAVMEDVPYITGLDSFLGEGMNEDTQGYLKDMGAASASNGAVGLYHVDKITPEAAEQGRSLLAEGYKTYVVDDSALERVLNSYPVMWKNENARPKLCFIGCPHLSLSQIYGWTDKLCRCVEGKGKRKLSVRTVLSAAPEVIEKFKGDGPYYKRLASTGASLTSICPLMYMNNPLCSKQAVITNSNKLRTYTTARFFTDEKILQIITA